jgi:hypothetical protein
MGPNDIIRSREELAVVATVRKLCLRDLRRKRLGNIPVLPFP